MERKNPKTLLLIDTNIFLEIILNRRHSEDAIKLLNKLRKGELYCNISSFSLHSVEVIIDKKDRLDILSKFLDVIENSAGIEIYYSSIEEEKEAVKFAKRFDLDFDDALQYYIAYKNNFSLVSFDRHFDKTNIKRFEPKDFI